MTAMVYSRTNQAHAAEALTVLEATLIEAQKLIEAGLGNGPLATPLKWGPRARTWLALLDGDEPPAALPEVKP